MKTQPNWAEILAECKTNIQTAIKPCLQNLKEPLPDLGLGAGGDAMKPVDLAAETAIIDTLKKHNVSFTLVSEESGVHEIGTSPQECFVTADPIDGTTNLMHGLPFYASSIAISDKPELAAVHSGMVVDLFRGTAYTAFKGKGAYRDGNKIHPSKINSLDDATIGVDFNAYKSKIPLPIFAPLVENIKHTRHFGANALEICFVAEGLTDSFIDLRGKIRTTDVAAGFLILKEAGGIVTTPDNKALNLPLDPKQTMSFIASGNVEIHKKIVDLVKPQC